MKHAYLIIAHNNKRILEILLSMLDDIRNDIYLHVDARSNLLDDLNVSLKHSHLYVLRNRIKVYWGTVSQIKQSTHFLRVHTLMALIHIIICLAE